MVHEKTAHKEQITAQAAQAGTSAHPAASSAPETQARSVGRGRPTALQFRQRIILQHQFVILWLLLQFSVIVEFFQFLVFLWFIFVLFVFFVVKQFFFLLFHFFQFLRLFVLIQFQQQFVH
jgi:cation transport ATPase